MLKVGYGTAEAIAKMGGDEAAVRKRLRAANVHRMWRELMEANGDQLILEHTNAVYIIRRTAEDYENSQGRLPHTPYEVWDDKKDAAATGIGKQLIVYVDDSLVASELNARRELIKMLFATKYGEDLDEFKIHISRGAYKQNHPFMETKPSYEDDAPDVPLTEEELADIHRRTQVIDDSRLRHRLEEAMRADLSWKKGIDARDAEEAKRRESKGRKPSW